MAGDSSILVQSIATGAGYPVAVTYENISVVGTAGIQWVQARSSGQPIGTVTGSLQATVAGSVVATQGGPPWTFTGSAVIQGSVQATVAGSVQATVAGSVAASQAGAWVFTGSVQATQASSPWVVLPGSTGQPQGTVVASIIGLPTVIGSVNVVGSVQATVQGSVLATQGGAPWSVIGSVNATQTTSPWVVLPGSTGQPQGTVVASIIGVPTVTGSVAITMANTLQPLTVIVTSQMGGGSTVTGSVFATLVVSGGAAVAVTSLSGGGALKVDLVQGTISGADGAILDGTTAAIKASVRSYAGGINALATTLVSSGGVLAAVTSLAAGNALKVDLVQGTISGANGAVLDGIDNSIAATVNSYATGKPQSVILTDKTGAPQWPLATVGSVSVIGSVGAIVAGSVQATVIGSVAASQAGAWTFTGSVQATQASSPWVVLPGSTGQPQGTVVASVIGVPTIIGSVSVTGSVGALVSGSVQATVIGSVQATVVGSVVATQGGAPWTVTGSVQTIGTIASSVQVSSAHPPVLIGGFALPAGTVPPAVGSYGAIAALFTPTGLQRVAVDSAQATVIGSFAGTVVASVIGVPAIVGSVSVTGSVGAIVAGSVQATVIGSVAATQAGAWVFTGSVQVTQASSPWIMLAGSTGQPQGTTVASIIGVPTVAGSVFVTMANTLAPLTVIVTSQMGGGSSITGSVAATIVGGSITISTVTSIAHRRVFVNSGVSIELSGPTTGALTNRKELRFVNLGPEIVYVGGTSSVTATGSYGGMPYPYLASDLFTLSNSARLYAYVATTSGEVAVMEGGF